MDPARLKDRSAYSIHYAFNGKITQLVSGEVPSNFKNSWQTQADWHLQNINKAKQITKNFITVIDITGVGD